MINEQEPALDADYAKLPEAIRHDLSHREWAWLSDAQKANLMQTETEPESFND